jgi:ABC-type nitrate/sulfonate/bicarbonate transport system substrate-binding protein
VVLVTKHLDCIGVGSSIGVRAVPESAARAVGLRQGRLEAAELDASDTIRLKVTLPDQVVLARLSDYKRVTGQLAFVTRPEFAAEHGALLQKFVDGILGASSTLYGPDGRAAFIRVAQANALKGDSADLVGKTYDYYRSVGMWPRASAPITADEYRTTQKFFRDTGQIESEVPFARAWNLAFWKEG